LEEVIDGTPITDAIYALDFSDGLFKLWWREGEKNWSTSAHDTWLDYISYPLIEQESLYLAYYYPKEAVQ
jgi:hypothetical protein